MPPGIGAGKPVHPFAVTVEEPVPVRVYSVLIRYRLAKDSFMLTER